MCTCMLRKDTQTNKENWISLPLSDLRKMYTTEAQQKFLEEQVVASRGHDDRCLDALACFPL